MKTEIIFAKSLLVLNIRNFECEDKAPIIFVDRDEDCKLPCL